MKKEIASLLAAASLSLTLVDYNPGVVGTPQPLAPQGGEVGTDPNFANAPLAPGFGTPTPGVTSGLSNPPVQQPGVAGQPGQPGQQPGQPVQPGQPGQPGMAGNSTDNNSNTGAGGTTGGSTGAGSGSASSNSGNTGGGATFEGPSGGAPGSAPAGNAGG